MDIFLGYKLLNKYENANGAFKKLTPGTPEAIEAAWQSHDTRLELQHWLLENAKELIRKAMT